MSENHIQSSFNSGEWAPQLYARVDIQRYRSGAALLENFFVDYRGGASTRTGTGYVIQAWDSTHPVRLIRFQAGFNNGYAMEFGQGYMRPLYYGAPILNIPTAITGATQTNPCVLTIASSTPTLGQWIYVAGVGGMTQLNGRYFKVINVAGTAVSIGDLNGANINSTGYTAYTTGGTSGTLYTISTPYAGADLALLKFSQTGNLMVLVHPNYVPYSLTFVSATNWILAAIPIGPTISAPTSISISTTLPPYVYDPYPSNVVWGHSYYSYCVTAVTANGQESIASNVVGCGPVSDMRVFPSYGTNQIGWASVAGAQYYKIYAANISTFGIQPPTVQYGYEGYSIGNTFVDDNIAPDFSQGIPVAQNPFASGGVGVASVDVTVPGTYTTVPAVSDSGSPTTPATYYAVLSANALPTITSGGTGYAAGDLVSFGYGITMVVLTVSAGVISSWALLGPGSITAGSTPSNPLSQANSNGGGTGATATVIWGVGQVVVTNGGEGYGSTPTIIFTPSGASATAILQPTTNGNPSTCGFFQQRLVLAGPTNAPQTFNMSQPGDYYNYDIHQPVVASDAITGTLISNQPNNIKSIVSVPAGMLVFTDQAAWVVNGGGSFQGISAAVSPENIVAAAQSFIGANDLPPITINYDILFCQSKGNQVRDLAYNIYFNVFTGTDISLISSHLFYGYNLTEWAWAESPFFVVWAVRNDGILLSLTFLKEQEFAGWAHTTTTNGAFQSVCAVTENTATAGTVDAVYTVVKRVINGNTIRYIERFADRAFPNGLISSWCVDCGQQFTGSATLSFQGAEHLAGQTVTGLAQDNLNNVVKIVPFAMPVSGFFTLPAPTAPGATGWTTVTIGLAFNCSLQTLPLEVGEPSIQGKTKAINSVVVRVADTLGLSIGSSASTLVPMKDLVEGNVSSMLTGQPSQIVTGLVNGDAKTVLDPTYTVPGQYYIRQSNPYPASVLGVFPQFTSEGRER